MAYCNKTKVSQLSKRLSIGWKMAMSGSCDRPLFWCSRDEPWPASVHTPATTDLRTVEIEKSLHVPPDAHRVPELVEDLCDYLNEQWGQRTAIHLAAYVLWRLNWIHPFDDGNGRTSRMVSYIVLLIKQRTLYGGSPTIPDLIKQHRSGYFAALDAADDRLKRDGVIDVSDTEKLISSLFAQQLTSIYKEAGGTILQNTSAV